MAVRPTYLYILGVVLILVGALWTLSLPEGDTARVQTLLAFVGLIITLGGLVIHALENRQREAGHPALFVEAHIAEPSRTDGHLAIISPYAERTLVCDLEVVCSHGPAFQVERLGVEVHDFRQSRHVAMAHEIGPWPVPRDRPVSRRFEICAGDFEPPLQELPGENWVRGLVWAEITGRKKRIEQPLPYLGT